ncbi:MAG: signal peptidase [Thermoguttaceae bacterium]|nr:signal peptidase [Thermoguttaceae bacterium]MBQ2038409.1 signal peptidase [Thermoguttaceae bacterium]MBQ4079767.1 signal peptidase [Thermoguttaceae bacterium]MBQ4196005.1 signal peptidase [Thermoguttaceae bacterium]MBQ4202584.1 signal peptidase [Thermoguttaceae bacterium]
MKKFVVRYGAMRYLGIVEVSEKAAVGFIHGTPVVIKTPRGQEAATVLTETDGEKIAKIPNLVGDPLTFIRRTTREDEERIAAIKAEEKNNFNRCLKIVERMRVELTLVRVEQIFGRERVVVYYVADGRVDFRELVRALAAEFQTRIEMKQIGVRDETKLLADVGDCGREVCCNTFLATMPPVSMKMAKLQKATLDPTKVSGRCGRLKCCLRYEFDAYYELQEASPAIGQTVWTPLGRGRVFAQELFAKRVVVDLEDGGRQSFDVEEIDVGDPRRRKRADRGPNRRDFNEYNSYFDDDRRP